MKVFVGYGGPRAQRFAKRLAKHIRRKGHKAFIAAPGSRNMIAGLNLNKRIFRALADADVMIMVCTRATVNSRHANAEIGFAQEIDTPVVPFIEEGSPVPRKLNREEIWGTHFSGEEPSVKYPEVISTLRQLTQTVAGSRAIRREAYV